MAESESESSASEQIIESDDGVEAKARLYCRNCSKIVKRMDSKLKLEANAKWKDSNGILHSGKLNFGLTQRSKRLQDYFQRSTQTIYK